MRRRVNHNVVRFRADRHRMTDGRSGANPTGREQPLSTPSEPFKSRRPSIMRIRFCTHIGTIYPRLLLLL